MSIIHIIPESVFLCDDQGSFKDVGGRVAQFQCSGQAYRQVRINGDDPGLVEGALRGGTPSRIFIEYSYFPKVVSTLRARFPQATIAVRAHNIEPLQNIADKGLSSMAKVPRVLYGSARYLVADYRMRQNSDIIFAINDWELKNYWRFVPGHAQLVWLPYYTPRPLIPERHDEQSKLILCLPNKSVNRKSRDLVARFCKFAAIGSKLRPDLRFAITRSPKDWGIDATGGIETLGYQNQLKELMSRVLAVAVLSPMGYGFKTTIMDAIASGAWAITHRRLYKRIPSAVQSCCVPCGQLTRGEVARTLERLTERPPAKTINATLRDQAQAVLDTQFIQVQAVK